MEIHTLRMQGLGIRKIATVLGISRNAVRRALRSSAPPTGKRHRSKGVKLAPFYPAIATWITDPIKCHWTAERIFDELQELGYTGGRTVVKEYLLTVRPKPRQQAEARFFVRPGQQMQVDWAEMGPAVIDGRSRKVYVFLAVLSWSRQLYVRATTDMELLTWLDCHRRALEFFGGVPDEVLIDNLKTGVLSRAGGTVRWHPAYQEFAVAHGFRPIAHFPCRPKTKGRVERIVRFTRERFFLGRNFSDLDGLNAQAESWLRERANTRVHRITRERPVDRLAVERERLHPMPDYDLVIEEPRVADAYALVSVRGCRYSVPAAYARTPTRRRAFVKSIGGRCWNSDAPLPCTRPLSYGFQNLAPTTSAISTLYDWYRLSIVVMRIMLEGASVINGALAGFCPIVKSSTAPRAQTRGSMPAQISIPASSPSCGAPS